MGISKDCFRFEADLVLLMHCEFFAAVSGACSHGTVAVT
jgi:hypothetical protein